MFVSAVGFVRITLSPFVSGRGSVVIASELSEPITNPSIVRSAAKEGAEKRNREETAAAMKLL